MKESIYPCMWFENEAKEAADYYCRIFPDSRIINESQIVVNFELNGDKFMALNGRRSPNCFDESISFVIKCDTQEEIDYYWNKLTAEGGKESMCGWCTDKFGISWQVIPAILEVLLNDTQKAEKVVEVFLKMKKFDIEKLLQV